MLSLRVVKVFVVLLLVIAINSKAEAMIPDIELIAKQAILIDYDTGQTLFEKNGFEKMPPASMSKLMAAYLVFERLKEGRLSLDDELTVSRNAWEKGGATSGGSTMFLPPNSTAKVEDLLKGMIIQSGNDACITIAENLAGSEEKFAEEMTAKAKEIGLENSSFKNSTGLPDPEHYMSPADLAKLARLIIINFPEYFKLYSEKSFTYNGITQGNRNPLLYSMPEADGMKTGYTSESGYGLVGTAKKNNRRLISVVNGLTKQSQRGEETQKLLNWGFREFDNYKLFAAGAKVGDVPVIMGKEEKINAVTEQDIVLTIPQSKRKDTAISNVFDQKIIAPVKKGQKIGVLKISIPEIKDYEYPLVAEKDVEILGLPARIITYIKLKIMGFHGK